MITRKYLISLIRDVAGEEVRGGDARRVESSRSASWLEPVPTWPAQPSCRQA